MMAAPLALVSAPFNRRTVIARLENLRERYARILEWNDHGADRRRLGRDLLLRHPSALREALEIDADEARHREWLTRFELERTRAAAPLPPADLSARRMHALSELEPLMLELRRLRRMRQLARPVQGDPALDAVQPALLELAGSPPAEHLGTLVVWLAERYQAPGWWTWVWGPRGEEVDVGAVEEFPTGQLVRRQGPDAPIVLLRLPDGFLAASAECPHRGGDLSAGELEDDHVICPVHAWSFSLRDGTTPADPRCRLPLYDVRVVEGRVRVRAERC